MKPTFRHKVGKTTLSGYIPILEQEEKLFIDPEQDPGVAGVSLRISFGTPAREVEARLYRTAGRAAHLKIAYTGKEGASFRAWLRQRFPARRVRKPRGVLILKPIGELRFQAEAESVRQAEVDRLMPIGVHYFKGAKPVRFLHPAMVDLDDRIGQIILSAKDRLSTVRERIQAALDEAGWRAADSVGSGLALKAGLRRTGAQLHIVLTAEELYPGLLSLAAAQELGECDLGVLLVADGGLSSRMRRTGSGSAVTIKRALREIEQLIFLVRGPVCMLGLDVRRQIQ